jgi:hypothetical protein
MANTLPNVPANASPEVQNSALNQVIDLINQQQRTQIISDAGGNRMIFGYQKGGWPAGDFGMKISAPGSDVATAALQDLLFYWDFTTGTQYWNYNSINYMQMGILPDATGGFAIARPGVNVKDAFNG